MKIINSDNAGNHVYFTGLVPYSDVPAFLSACDVLHAPSINNEDSSEYFGSPTKLFEYMGMSKPIVATSVGQQKEVIRHMTNGILIDEKSPESIALAIESLAKDDALRNTLSRNSRNDAVEKWDWKNNVMRIITEF